MTIGVGIIGCGLIGSRRAQDAHEHPCSCVKYVSDVVPESSLLLADKYGCESASDWKTMVADKSVDIVVICTPNGFATEIAVAALSAGKHVLVEKPPGRNLSETLRLSNTAHRTGLVLKVGFNHRYHPAISRARDVVAQGTIGDVIHVRARYGHGGRPGYEQEWRANPVHAGGGELLDQGIHIADLFHWFLGVPLEAFAWLQTAVWPIEPLEDSAFGMFRYHDGKVASLHTSWTQWKNLFSFEIFGESGSVSIEGLGGSYGTERLITAIRRSTGGPPRINEEEFPGPDLSWKSEWADFVSAVTENKPYWGTPQDGINAMAMIDALYRSAHSGTVASLEEKQAAES